MQTGAKPNATDDRRDFVVIPPDQVRVAPSDAEITDLLRAAARHHSEAGVRATSDPSAPVPAVDTTFRATAVNDEVPVRGSTFGRRVVRAVAALLLAAGIGGAAFGWQVFGYAAKKAVGRWLPQLALTSSLSLDKLGFASESKPSGDATDATSAPAAASAPSAAASAPSATDSVAPADGAVNAAAAAPPDAAQQLQSMARDLANANQEVETLKASIAELKAGQQQMARDLSKVSEKFAEQNARAKVASATQHAAAAARKPAPLYSPTPVAPPPAYRPSYSAQAAATPALPPVTAQPYVPPPPISLQPQGDPGLAPRPPMPVQ
jgi:hypothetical protein